MNCRPIDSVEDAIAFLRSAEQEVLDWGGSWIVYEAGPEDAETWWSAESDTALIAGARLEQSITLCLARDNCVPGAATWCNCAQSPSADEHVRAPTLRGDDHASGGAP